jgi:predicted outer membrane repeat protein
MKRCFPGTAVAVCLFLPVVAHAATLLVTSPNDTGTGSLRAAVSVAANGDTITFDPSLNGATITLTSGEIAIAKTLTITGPGAANLAISGNQSSRVFNISAPTTISGLTLSNGQNSGNGGAILTSAMLTLNADTFTANYCGNSGGAVTSRFGAMLVISDSTFSDNTSDFLGGALYTDGSGSSIAGTTFSGNTVQNAGVGGAIFNGGTLSITQCTITDNSAVGEGSVAGGIPGVGGAIFNGGTLSITQCTIRDNSAVGEGSIAGGIYSSSFLTITDSTLSGNSADAGGWGGGLYNGGTATFRNSTLSGNACGDATPYFESQGAAIFNEGGCTVNIVDSTVADNTVGADAQGGGIFNDGTVQLHCSTIAGNTTGANGTGGGIFNDGGTVSGSNNIIAANRAPTAADFSGILTSQGFNLIGDANGLSGVVAGDLINMDPKLGPLQNNGGLTSTMALLAGSPAIDQGDPAFNPNAFTPPLTTDQHGADRVINGRIDIGAFEADVQPLPSIDSLTSAQTLECTSNQGTNASVTATVSDNQGQALTVQWFVDGQLKQTDQVPGASPTTHGSSTYSGTFPLGTTTLMVSVTDGQSDPVMQSTTVTVVDTTPPTISDLSANPDILSPPNHKMVAVTVTAAVTDICDSSPTSRIVSVSSNESGPGQFQITGDMTVDLLSERKGTGSGRVYTMTVQATDASGNSSTGTVTVSVPKNQHGKKKKQK